MNARLFGLWLTLVALALAGTVQAAPGAEWKGSGGWGPQGAYGRLYDPATVETVRGKVVEVQRMSPMKGMSAGLHLTLKTQAGPVSVYLGPAWYLERLDTRIEKGDEIEVRGSRVTLQGKAGIIAAEVKKGDEVLRLRDDSGIPAWSGWRRGK